MKKILNGTAIGAISFVIITITAYPPKGWDAVMYYMMLVVSFMWLHRK